VFSNHPATGTEPWPDIDPAFIEDARGAVPLFPLDLLPQPWRGWVSETARAAGAPVDYAVQALLAAVSALCGAGVLVRVTPAWSEPLVLWQALVGPSSSGKSPALEPVRALLTALEPEVAAGTEQARPQSRIVLDDPALVGVADALAINPRGVLLWRDVPSSWIAGLGGADESERAQWLEAWRAGRFMLRPTKSPALQRFPVSVLGTLRPDDLVDALSEADAGLCARFLYAWPDPPSYTPLAERRPPRDDLALDLLRKIHRAARTSADPLLLPLAPEAAKAFDGFLSLLHRDLAHAEGLEADWMGKGSGTVARLAGILELLAWSASESGALPKTVGAPAVEAAIRLWSDYLRPHAVQVLLRAGPTDLMRQSRRVVRWLASHRRGEVTREEIRTQALSRSVNAGRADFVIGHLSAGGVLRLIKQASGPQGGRPPLRWQVNPALAGPKRLPETPGNLPIRASPPPAGT
jgi:hypothetical protein